MSSVDSRVVGMKFDNAQFEQGVKTTVGTLDKLNQSLKLDGATKGLNDVGRSASNIQLGTLAAGIDTIADKFKTMSVVAITALATIASKAITVGFGLAKSLTVDPINAGLQEYQTNINSIQTILSNTRWQNTGLKDVTAALDELNRYADLTIYDFTEMARNIGTFTAAGVKMDVAVNAIKGIANLAAVSGSSAEQASVAMYQLSQAIATGTVKLIDWNSVVNAGLGGKVFQDALIETARVHHVAVDQMIKDAGSFRGSLENGWLTAQILTETLSHFTGDLNEKQLLSLGYSKEQAKAIVAMGKDALDAATKVKTITQLLSTLREAAGSGWTQTWSIIFGNFNEARDLFTNVYKTLNVFVQANADARNKVLQDWKDLGGRAALIEAIGNAFKALISVLKPIRDAWRQIFPPATGDQLAALSRILKFFTAGLILTDDTANKLRRSFAGLFAIFGIVWKVIKLLVSSLAFVVNAGRPAASSILDITARIGDFLVGVQKAIDQGYGFAHFFQFLTRTLEYPVKAIDYLLAALDALFSGFDGTKAAEQAHALIQQFTPLELMGRIIAQVWSKTVTVFGKFFNIFEPIALRVGQFMRELSAAVGGINFETVLHTINTGAFAGLVLILKKNFGKNKGITAVFNELTNSLKTMQHTLQAATILEIALAILALSVAVVALSDVNAAQLAAALTGMGIMFGQLIGALAILKTLPGGGVVRIYAFAGAMVLLAVAIDILAIGVKKLATIDAKQLHKGLIGVVTLILAVTTAARLMPKSATLIPAAIAITILGAALNIFAEAVKQLSHLSWEELAKGLSAVGALLLELTLFSRFAEANAKSVLSGAGIILLATGILILSTALKNLGSMSWEAIGKGLTTLAGALVSIGVALSLMPAKSIISSAGVLIVATSLGLIADALGQMGGYNWLVIGKGLTALAGALALIGVAISLIPPTAPLSAAGVLIVALALGMIGDALLKMGGMGWVEIAKGLTTLGGALGIISGALLLMSGTLSGAAALLVVSSALVILTGVLKVLGNMPISEILIGLGALAGALFVLGLAGYAIAPVVPALLGLAGAIALIGLGLALIGGAVFLFSAGITALAASGAAASAAIVALASAVIGIIPALVQQVGIALVALLKIIVAAVPEILKLLVSIVVGFLDAFTQIEPSLAKALVALLALFLAIVINATPKLVNAGIVLMLSFLRAIRDHIRDMTGAAVDIVVNFVKALGDNLPKIIQAGVDFIIKLLEGIGKGAKDNGPRLAQAGVDLATGIIEGILSGIAAGAQRIIDKLIELAKEAWHAVLDFLGIGSPSKLFIEVGKNTVAGFAVGLDKYAYYSSRAAEKMGKSALDTLSDTLASVSDVVDSGIDLTPTITPVLDLSSVKKDATTLDQMLSGKAITVNAATITAKQTSSEFNQNMADVQAAQNDKGDTFNFTQNNTSPKALSPAEIYRQTRNQLSVVKKEVVPVS